MDANGALVLRNEDLDPQRSKADFAGAMLEDLQWLGIHWHEGPDVGGTFGPYSQSERRELYFNVWKALRDRGCIYPCTCSRRELSGIAQAPHELPGGHRTPTVEGDEGPMYPGTCRAREYSLSQYERPAGVNWRFRVPDGAAVAFEDGHSGSQRFVAGEDFGDFPIWRRDDVPAYQLAVVADDHAMEITEVVRGADLLLSTARQILIYDALGWGTPHWYHCPLVVDERGERLAKRHDALAIRTLRSEGKTSGEVLGTV